mmetsp:Transcript_30857/g.65268  ORF Transcript_30857/g.65268 Transcript_30857/m.65268 type:complete len:202 (+) Transcript_30857:1424-2029(+)
MVRCSNVQMKLRPIHPDGSVIMAENRFFDFRNSDCDTCLRQQSLRKRKRTSYYGKTIGLESPPTLKVIQRCEKSAIDHAKHKALHQQIILQHEIHRLHAFFELDHGRMRHPLRRYHAVDIEIRIVRHISVVATVGNVAILVAQPLIDPIPDESALQAFMLFDDFPIVGEAAGRVPHCVCILTHDKRPHFIPPRSNLLGPPH